MTKGVAPGQIELEHMAPIALYRTARPGALASTSLPRSGSQCSGRSQRGTYSLRFNPQESRRLSPRGRQWTGRRTLLLRRFIGFGTGEESRVQDSHRNNGLHAGWTPYGCRFQLHASDALLQQDGTARAVNNMRTVDTEIPRTLRLARYYYCKYLNLIGHAKRGINNG